MLVLNSEEVVRSLPMRKTIESMKSAYASLSSGKAVIPLRINLPVEKHKASAFFMPAYVSNDENDTLAVKVAALFPGNTAKNLPAIHAAVLVMDSETGQMLAMIEGGTLTAIRTGAGAGAATDLLARPDSHIAAIFGSGPQAATQLEAICSVRPIQLARIYSRNPENVSKLISEMTHRVGAELAAATSPTEALADADIVCAATNASEPVFDDADIKPGMHINGVGSYTHQMIEIPPQTVARSLVTVDSRTACAAEAGEVIEAVSRGLLESNQIHEIGEVVQHIHPGRTSIEQITYFKSVGVAVQDAAAAQLALAMAHELGLGTEVDW